MNAENNYVTFLRSARNFEEFSKAEKLVQETGLSYSAARAMCENFNNNRDADDIAAGTKMEFSTPDYL